MELDEKVKNSTFFTRYGAHRLYSGTKQIMQVSSLKALARVVTIVTEQYVSIDGVVVGSVAVLCERTRTMCTSRRNTSKRSDDIAPSLHSVRSSLSLLR